MFRDFNYSLGLDIGITSVGWAVINLDLNRIEDLGVRIFEAAENRKTGASLALPRRLARGRRRLLRRKSYRVRRIKKLILEKKILTRIEMDNLFEDKDVIGVWDARVKGLDEKLSGKEWAKLLINYCKRRGFKSNRKNEKKDKETGKVLVSINLNLEKMIETNSRTIGEYIYNNVKGSYDEYAPLRNKDGKYNMCISRDMLLEEIIYLFKKQREFGNEFATEEIESEYIEIFKSQRPFSKIEDLEKMIGFCTFEKSEKRAPKNCISSEEFVLYESINKLSIIKDGDKRKLSDEERKLVVNAAFSKKEVKYKALRKLLKLDSNERFSTLTYSINKDIDKTEDTKFVSLSGYYYIRKVITTRVSKDAWNNIKDNRNLLNDIAYVLTLGKTDSEIIKHLKIKNVPEDFIEPLTELSFSKVSNLSIVALERILPFLKEGYQYDKACEKAGYDFKNIYKGKKSKKLPLINIDEINNPVVNRALAQTRKVVNSIIEIYGSPTQINIELARELGKNKKKRDLIKDKQDKNKVIRENARKRLIEVFDKEPTSMEILKYRLWEEQKGKCAYTQKTITIDMLFSVGCAEIDHIIPFSRSFDDSYLNKVLVLSKENQDKCNRIPYEYFGNNVEKWSSFVEWVKTSNLDYRKKDNLLKKEVSIDGWKERNLQDTRYITKYIASFIRNKLEFKEGSNKKKVNTVNGIVTGYLRARWGLNKVREDGDKHHALDAVVVAVTTDGMIQQITRYSKANELFKVFKNNEKVVDFNGDSLNSNELRQIKAENPYFPKPWIGFTEELKLRLSENPMQELEESQIKTYDDNFIKNRVKPIFVSRVPNRKVSGAFFGETIYSSKAFKEEIFVAKKKLTKLKKEDLNKFYNYSCDKKLYDAIEEKMIENNYNAKEAFKEPFRKPTKSGKEGPIVRSVKIISKIPFKDGVKINDTENSGLVKRDRTTRIDIYVKDDKHYVVPVYSYQVKLGKIPKKAAVAGKSEENWTDIDETYTFKFSIYKNDLISIVYINGKKYFGYYNGFDRASATLTVKKHDNSIEYRGVGIKQSVDTFNKYDVDVLGNYHKIKNRL